MAHAVLFQILLLSLSVDFLSGPGHGINAWNRWGHDISTWIKNFEITVLRVDTEFDFCICPGWLVLDIEMVWLKYSLWNLDNLSSRNDICLANYLRTFPIYLGFVPFLCDNQTRLYNLTWIMVTKNWPPLFSQVSSH